MSKVFIIVLILLVVGALSFAGYRYYAQDRGGGSVVAGEKGGKRQAVFLTNGQVYFGYISNTDKQIVTMRDIYYFKKDTVATEGQVSLVKLGNEMHGPEDVMYINRDHILFYEDMRDDARINQTINNAKNGQEGSQVEGIQGGSSVQ
ncbi:MAG: hypothetical protein BWY68_00050 [bacterium ADurb.Bin400]|nr:MAG: hypothetical protein BWY68_00050 [bacterium ADurb.Bin400]